MPYFKDKKNKKIVPIKVRFYSLNPYNFGQDNNEN